MGHQQPHHQWEERPGELGCGTSERNLELGSEACIFFWSTMRRFIKPATTLCVPLHIIFHHFSTFQAFTFFPRSDTVLSKDEFGDDDLVFLRAGGHHTCNHVPML